MNGNTDLTEDEIRQYQERGYLIVRNFLGRDRCREILQAVSDAVGTMGKKKVAGDNAADLVEEDAFYDHVFLQRVNLWKLSPFIKRFFTDPDLGGMLCRLSGAKRMRIWHDQTLQKMPWANATAWHLDDPYWSFHSKQSISIWIALDDATMQNGCLYYLPGAHKMACFETADIGQNMDGLFEVYPKFRNIEPVAAEMRVGDAGFHNGLLAHAAGPNMTPRPRRAMTCAFMPDGATFNGVRNILSEDYASRLRVGDPLQDDEQNPLVGG